MNKTSLSEVSPLIEKITQRAQSFIDSEVITSNMLFKEQEFLVPFSNKITVLTKAFRTATTGKNHEEIATLANFLVDKIDQTVNLHFQELKIKDLIAKSKKSGFEEIKQEIINSYSEALGDADRIVEVVTLIESDNEPALGRKRKIGTRPEKLSVVRRAQDIVKQKQNETSQKSE